MPSAVTIDQLSDKLQRLRKRDTLRIVFGAAGHDYASTRATEAELLALETHVGAALPEDYRVWLREVGYGAGPGYGLLSTRDAMAELRLDQRGSGGDVDSADLISDAHIRRYASAVSTAGTHIGIGITSNTFAGALPISHQGCGNYSHIMLAGHFRGAIFGEAGELIGEPWTAAAAFWPEPQLRGPTSDHHPASFLQWMDRWIEVSLALVN